MFERTLEEMTATILVGDTMFNTMCASNVGLGQSGIKRGWNVYTSAEAASIIKKIDAALLSCPKYLTKRICAVRMQFAFAFGPEMEELCATHK